MFLNIDPYLLVALNMIAMSLGFTAWHLWHDMGLRDLKIWRRDRDRDRDRTRT